MEPIPSQGLGESSSLEEEWTRYSGQREKATFATANLLICTLVPLWSAFDFLLEPDLAPRFIVLRIADVLLTITIWVFLSRSREVRRNRWAMWLSIVAVGVMIAAMLPQVPDHYSLYTFGFSLVFWGSGLLLLWPLRWVLASFGSILASHIVAHVALNDRVPLEQFVGLLFYLFSAAIISGAQHVVRLRLERQAFHASFTVEAQNKELAQTVAALEETQARLGATRTAVTESLDVATTSEQVVTLSVPAFASWAVLVVLGPDDRWIRSVGHPDPTIRSRLRSPRESSTSLHSDSAAAAVRLVDVSRADVARILDGEAAELLQARSLLVAPLIARGQKIGALVFGRSDRNYAASQLSLIEEVAHRAALALDNARLFHQLQTAVRARDEFLSIASHELRTPLAALRLTADRILQPPFEEARIVAAARRTERQIARLSALVDQLLDVARITEVRLVIEREELDLADLVRDVTHRFEPEAERHNCSIQTEIEEPLWGSWDRSRVDQVLTNLLSNAIKYGAGVPIRVSVASGAGSVELRVRDEGIGVAQEDQARIFDRFVRAGAARNYGGLGLGLWIVKNLVQLMGGTIRVESAPHRGATFVVELPWIQEGEAGCDA